MLIQANLVTGEEIEAHIDSNVCVVGRSSTCHLVIPHEGMSRKHCQIELIDGDYYVTDLGSTNGVLIDGERIEPHRKISYQTFRTLSFGAVQSLVIKEEEESSSQSVNKVLSKAETVRDQSSEAKVEAEGEIRLIKNKRSAPYSMPKIEIQENKFKTWVVNSAAIFLVLAAAAWYLLREEDSSPSSFSFGGASKEPQMKNYDQF